MAMTSMWPVSNSSRVSAHGPRRKMTWASISRASARMSSTLKPRGSPSSRYSNGRVSESPPKTIRRDGGGPASWAAPVAGVRTRTSRTAPPARPARMCMDERLAEKRGGAERGVGGAAAPPGTSGYWSETFTRSVPVSVRTLVATTTGRVFQSTFSLMFTSLPLSNQS